jgi:ribosomal protein L11 methyltransferase
MSDYLELKIICPVQIRDILTPILFSNHYEGFWEQDDGFIAYIPQEKFDPQILEHSINQVSSWKRDIHFETRIIPAVNWNRNWEENYEAVTIKGKYIIQAPFHKTENNTQKVFTIYPGMAFGTGHHETTKLMMELMDTMDFRGKRVLDFGCGTGILAIFAEYKGAADIIAIDEDPLAIESTEKNLILNQSKSIQIQQSNNLNSFASCFDIILGNLSRNALIKNANAIDRSLKQNGYVLLSGFFMDQKKEIAELFKEKLYIESDSISENTWVALKLQKK